MLFSIRMRSVDYYRRILALLAKRLFGVPVKGSVGHNSRSCTTERRICPEGLEALGDKPVCQIGETIETNWFVGSSSVLIANNYSQKAMSRHSK